MATPNLSNIPPVLLEQLKKTLGNLSGFLTQSGSTLSQEQLGKIGSTLGGLKSTLSSATLAPTPAVNLSGFQQSPSTAPNIRGGIEAQTAQNQAFIKQQQDQAKAAAETEATRQTELAKTQTAGETQRTGIQKLLEKLGITSATDTTADEQATLTAQQQKLEQDLKEREDIRISRAGLEKEAKIPQLTQEFTDLQNQIEQKQLALTRETEAIRKEPGLTIDQANLRIRDAERRGAMELADLSIIQNAKARNLTTAQATVDRTIQLRLEPLQERIEFDKFFYTEARAALTKAEDRDFNARIKQEEELRDFLKDQMEGIYDLSITALENGAPIELAQQIQQAGSKEAAMQLAGTFLSARAEDKVLSVAEAKSLGVPFGTTQSQAVAMGIIPSTGTGGTSFNKIIPNQQSTFTAQVLDGFTSLGELTPSERQKAKADLFTMGFNSDKTPDWFRDSIQDQLQMSLIPQALQEEWIKYRDEVMATEKSTGGGSGLNFDDL